MATTIHCIENRFKTERGSEREEKIYLRNRLQWKYFARKNKRHTSAGRSTIISLLIKWTNWINVPRARQIVTFIDYLITEGKKMEPFAQKNPIGERGETEFQLVFFVVLPSQSGKVVFFPPFIYIFLFLYWHHYWIIIDATYCCQWPHSLWSGSLFHFDFCAVRGMLFAFERV